MSLSAEYVAGFFDGEGCMSLGLCKKNSIVSLTAQLANTHRPTMVAIQKSFGGSLYEREKTRHWRTAYRLTWRGRTAIDLLKKIGPLLVTKRAQYELAISYWNNRIAAGRHVGESYGRGQKVPQSEKEKDLRFRADMMRLNVRGWAASANEAVS